MARPAKAVSVTERHNTKLEIETRKQTEDLLRGDADRLKPPSWLSKEQKKLFRVVVDGLEASDILGSLDIYILSQFAISVDRLQTIEQMVNDDLSLLHDKTLMATKEKYTKDFFRCCNELSLSPQSRAKIGTLSVNRDKDLKDPLLIALGGTQSSA